MPDKSDVKSTCPDCLMGRDEFEPEWQCPKCRKADVMRWVAVSERLPEIDTSNKWNNDNKITKDVLCWSKEWGMRFGRYFYSAGFWTVNGVTSSNGVTVEYWMDVKPPFA